MPVAVFVVFFAVAIAVVAVSVAVASGVGGEMGHIVEDAAQKLCLTGPQGVDGVVDLRRGDGVLPHHQHRRVGQVRQQLAVGEEAQRRRVDDHIVVLLPGQGHHLGQLVRGQQLDNVGIGLGAQQGVQPCGGVRDGGGEDLLRGGGL